MYAVRELLKGLKGDVETNRMWSRWSNLLRKAVLSKLSTTVQIVENNSHFKNQLESE